ncbi:MAG TPA: hypothetical protein VGR92_12625 [Steroidobacteraceae bacterium]|nr:hypothetical protein [Steroidobacteraceae bacterium]
MLVLVLLLEIALLIFLVGVLVIACAVTLRHGDPSATYQLYAVRDRLIEASVFEGVPRDNPWLNTLYENVNSVLLYSNMLGGPPHWSLAVAVGRYQAAHPGAVRELMPFPADAGHCPQAVRAVAPNLKRALEHLSKNHMGVMLQMSSHEREQRRIQRQKARDLLQMMRGDDRCGCPA